MSLGTAVGVDGFVLSRLVIANHSSINWRSAGAKTSALWCKALRTS